MSKTNGMADYDLGEIKRVGLREVWTDYEPSFSKWLAEEENLRLLGEVIGVEIRLVKTEASVGDFSVDILAETGDESKPTKIVIENQLERTDHTHLGQVITYASGVDAGIAVWVVKKAREEHRRAIDWLNEHTNDSLAFFLLQVELWQIDGSRPAPKFEIISKPNKWAKDFAKSSSGDVLAERRLQQDRFWELLGEYTDEHSTKLNLSKSSSRNRRCVKIGNGEHRIDLGVYKNNLVEADPATGMAVVMCVKASEVDLFRFLEGRRGEIEKDLGYEIVWKEYKAWPHAIQAERSCDWVNPKDEDFEWLLRTGERFQEVFPKYLKQYYDQGGE